VCVFRRDELVGCGNPAIPRKSGTFPSELTQ